MLVYASLCAALLLAGLGEAKEHHRPRAYKSINKLTVTNAYSGWNNSPDACFQLGLVPAFISKENRRAAAKAIRNAGKRHAWIYAVRYEGKWVSKRLKLQLPASARKLSNRELKEGEKGEVVEETNPNVSHVTVCEKPGAHKRRGHRRHSTGRRHRRHHRHHHDRHRSRSRDRDSHSLESKSHDDRSLSSDSRHYRSDARSHRHSHGRRHHRSNGLRRTGGGFLDARSSDTDKDNRRPARRDRSTDSRRSYDTKERRRSRRHRSLSSSSSDRGSLSSVASKDGSKSSYDSGDDYKRRHRSRRHRSHRSNRHRSSRRRSSRRDEGKAGHHHSVTVVAAGTCPFTGKTTAATSLERLLDAGSPNFIQ